METPQPTISKYMTTEPCGVDAGLTIADAADRMRANNIRHLIVLAGDRFVGVVGLDDLHLAAALAPDGPGRMPVAAATRRTLICAPTTPVAAVARGMERGHFECCVVVDDEQTVQGIFTITDALHALRELSLGHDVAPEVVPTHHVSPRAERTEALPSVRVARMLRSHGAAPRADDGIAFGKVFP